VRQARWLPSAHLVPAGANTSNETIEPCGMTIGQCSLEYLPRKICSNILAECSSDLRAIMARSTLNDGGAELVGQSVLNGGVHVSYLHQPIQCRSRARPRLWSRSLDIFHILPPLSVFSLSRFYIFNLPILRVSTTIRLRCSLQHERVPWLLLSLTSWLCPRIPIPKLLL
jgi:hypothetical protein